MRLFEPFDVSKGSKNSKSSRNSSMVYFRFDLQRGSSRTKIECPKCHRPKRFRLYIDKEGEFVFPEYVGICDRKNHCGYHYPPKKYFDEHPDMKPKNSEKPEFYRPKVNHAVISEAKETSFIKEDIMKRSLGAYESNKLFRFLAQHFPEDKTLSLFRKYNVGTSNYWNGATVFWQVDVNDKIRTGKVMLYDDTGHRIKKPINKINWAHSILHLKDYILKQCLFGEHLLKLDTKKPVALVESEKTALICSFYIPQYIWLATGGKSGFWKESVLNVLEGRRVLLFPDLKATLEWKEKIPLLKSVGADAFVYEDLEKLASDVEREEGLDIGDFLIKIQL